MFIIRVLMQTVALALGQIRANFARALLTSLGIIIGVGSVTAVIAGLTGMKGYVLSEFETFGAKKVFLDGRVPRELRNKIGWDEVALTLSEITDIRENCPSIALITPVMWNSFEVRNGEFVATGAPVQGIWPDWHTIEARTVTFGRPFNSIDETESRYVCLVNDKAIEELNLDRDPTGDFVLLNGRRFLIVGVVETKELGAMFGGGDSQVEVFIPFSTSKRMAPLRTISYAIAELTSPEAADDARAEVAFVLRNLRKLPPDWPDTFQVEVLQQFIDQFNGLAAGITAIAGGVVSISLLVGGVGIMNIMLVSVSERTREIGLRKAVGAKSAIILLQFLVEAIVLCVAGGIIGLALGQALTLALQNLPGAQLGAAHIPGWAVSLAFLFSAAVGVIFGMFPAIKAARLDPIEALRHE
jgi:putative ABC transport system permease protein